MNSLQSDSFALSTLSPLDGRYRSGTAILAECFSEFALIQRRVRVEVAYLLFLSDEKLIPGFSDSAKKQLHTFATSLALEQAEEIKTIEQETKHDVKAVEYFLRHKMENMGVAGGEFIHLGLTSEDTNSLALGLMLKESIDEVIVSQLREVLSQLTTLAVTTKDAVLLARTHGQPAIPTTMGKEIMVFAVRLFEELQLLTSLPIEAKLSGAVGTFAAQTTAFPKADWESLSQRFITQLGLTPATLTTQIVSAEAYSRIFASIARINSILLDLDQDIWRYISDGYFVQQKSKNQVGSSTMPHKVNPIDFENSEGNLGLSNALLNFFIQKLPISRLQRDLSDSTVKRSIGSALGYAYLGYSSLLKGLGKITLEPRRLQEELKAHSEVVTEGFQVLLRAHGEQRGYEKLQAFSQGKKITTKNITEFIDSLDVSQTLKDELRAITPQTYIGLASKLVETHTARINTYLKGHS